MNNHEQRPPPEMKEKCLETGMDDYPAKPVQKTDLEAMLMKYSREPAQRPEALYN